MLQKVANLRLLHLPDLFFATTDLDRIGSVFLLSFNLRDLTAVKLDDCAGLQLSPFVPKMSAANFVTQSSDPHRVSGCFFSWLDLKLRINLFFKTLKGLHLVGNAILACIGYSIIVQTVLFCQSQIGVTCFFQRADCLWLFNDLGAENPHVYLVH